MNAIPPPERRDHGWNDSKPGPVPIVDSTYYTLPEKIHPSIKRLATRTVRRYIDTAEERRALLAMLFARHRKDQLEPGKRMGDVQ